MLPNIPCLRYKYYYVMKNICIKKGKAKKGRKSLCCMSAIQTGLKDSRDMQAIPICKYTYIYICVCKWSFTYLLSMQTYKHTFINTNAYLYTYKLKTMHACLASSVWISLPWLIIARIYLQTLKPPTTDKRFTFRKLKEIPKATEMCGFAANKR